MQVQRPQTRPTLELRQTDDGQPPSVIYDLDPRCRTISSLAAELVASKRRHPTAHTKR